MNVTLSLWTHVHVGGLIRLAVPNSFPCSHLGEGITMGMIHGVIPTATDLAPAHIWEECDLTILFFQRPIPVCSSPRPGLKHASVPEEGEREEGRNRGREIVERVKLCVCVSFPNSQSGGRQVIVIPGQKQAWTALFFSLTVCT